MRKKEKRSEENGGIANGGGGGGGNGKECKTEGRAKKQTGYEFILESGVLHFKYFIWRKKLRNGKT